MINNKNFLHKLTVVEDLSYFKYACEIGKSFPKYKNMLEDNRRNLKF